MTVKIASAGSLVPNFGGLGPRYGSKPLIKYLVLTVDAHPPIWKIHEKPLLEVLTHPVQLPLLWLWIKIKDQTARRLSPFFVMNPQLG